MNTTWLRIRNRIGREYLLRRLRPNSRMELVRLGTDYGGWWLPRWAVAPGVVAYCAGAGEDISFDLALHEAGVTVATFDPTPRAIAFVAEVNPGPPFRFVPIGWWDSRDEIRFYSPKNPTHVSHSIVNLQGTNEYFIAQVDTVASCMERLNDTSLDIVKMDIEGAEYAVIDSMLRDGILPSVLLVEFDQPRPWRDVVSAVGRLANAGYTLARVDYWNYTFVRESATSGQ